ncbi:MAG: hypothetical protein WCV90_00995 [Candidatus Woesearchaeota archaeon]
MQKRIGIYLLLTLLLVSFASASFIDDVETFKNDIGITEPLLILVIRLAILSIVALLLYEGISKLGLSQGAAGGIAFLIAAISAVFIPGGVLAAVASTYAVVISVILILLPIAALMFLVYAVIPGTSLAWRGLRIALIILTWVLLSMFKSWLGSLSTSSPESALLLSTLNQYFWLVIVGVVILLLVEIARAFSLRKKEGAAKKIEEKMVKGGESEPAAEKEVKEEDKTRKKDKKVFNFAVDEFSLLKELKTELDNINPDKDVDFYGGKAGKKLKALRKEEKLESKMQKRIKALEIEGKKLAGKEPSLKGKIEELLLEIGKNQEQLLFLMAKHGKFEVIANTPISATLTPEQKKARLQAILQDAIHYDEEIIAAAQKLGSLVK